MHKREKMSYMLMVALLLMVSACDTPTGISEEASPDPVAEEPADDVPMLTVSAETRSILNSARAAAPIDTSGQFAYGVLDAERSATSALVAYYNASVYEKYQFNLIDGTWTRGELQDSEPAYGASKSQTYTLAIAELYNGPTIIDTWYVPGNQQTNGTFDYVEEYSTQLPTNVVFLNGTQIDASTTPKLDHTISFVGPWEFCRAFSEPAPHDFQCRTTNASSADTEVTNIWNVAEFGPAERVTVTYSHTIITVQPASTPSLIAPSNGQTNTSTSTRYRWGASTGDGTITYQIQVDDDAGFGSPLVDESGITSRFKRVTSHDGGAVYYWRVRATNEAGTSAWSSVYSHTTRPKTPSVTGSVVSGKPKLTWPAAQGATSYQIYKRTDTGNWNIYGTTSGTAYTDHLASVTGYNGSRATPPYVAYRVKSLGQNGTSSSFSSVHYFDIGGGGTGGPE